MLNKTGKILLLVSLGVLILLIYTAIFHDSMEFMSDVVFSFACIISVFSFCLSLTLIYFHSEKRKRKKVVAILSITSILIFALGVTSKLLWAPGAGIEISFSIALFSFGTLPLIIKSRYENRRSLLSATVLLLSFADLTSIFLTCIGVLARFLHWPFASGMFWTGITLLVISMISWNFSFRKEVKRRMEAEEKLKHTLNELEEKQQEILSSIRYAKRIQQAHLPNESTISKHLGRLKGN